MRSLSAPVAVVALAVAIIIVGAIVSIALQSQVFAPPPKPGTGVEIYVGQPGSTSYIIGERIAELLRAQGVAAYTVTADPVVALKLVTASNKSFAIVTADLAYLAYHGLEPFSNETKELPRAIASLYPVALQIVARGDTGIASLEGLEGRTLVVGPKHGHIDVLVEAVLEAAGVEPVYIYADILRGVEMFRLGSVDAIALASGVPDPTIYQLSTVLPVKLLKVPFKSVEEKLREKGFTFIYPYEIPANTYNGQAKAVETVAVSALLVASKNTDPDLVAKVLKTVIENTKTVFQGLPQEKYYNATTALEGVSIPLQLGAVRYYLQAEVNVPGTLIPPEVVGG